MRDYEKLEWLIAETDTLIAQEVRPTTPEFQLWFSEAERFLIKRFGQDSFEHTKLKKTSFLPSAYISTSDVVRKCKEGLTATKLIFESYLSEMQDEDLALSVAVQQTVNNKVFIVHGHDGELKEAVARLVEKQDLTAVILNEQVNKGKTIIEKIEGNSDVGGAICLFTADDLGCAKDEPNEQPRARQNVVFEAGYFMGKLGRDRVVIIAEKGVELPSDMQGIVYSDKNDWQVDVLKELKAMSYTIDFNKFF